MPQVPYTPVPDVVPSAGGAPQLGISTPPAAFGITAAEAEQGLGRQAEQSADQLSRTALAIKGMENETWAKNNFIDQSAKLGQIEADFYSLKGQQAVDAMPKYRQDVKDLYDNAVANAPNPQAQRFLADTLSRRISYSIVDGQRHAGEQRVVAQNGASSGMVAAAIGGVVLHPYDDKAFGDAKAVIRSEAQAQAEHSGIPSSNQANVEKWTSMLWEQRLHAIGFDHPEIAEQMLKDHRDEIKGIHPSGKSYLEEVTEWLQGRQNIIGTRNAAHEITGKFTANSGPADLDAALDKAHTKAINEQPDNPQYEDNLKSRVITEYHRVVGEAKQAELQTYNTLFGVAIGANGGNRATSIDAILNNPTLASQFAQLSPPRQEQLRKVIENNFKGGTLTAAEQVPIFEKYMGMAALARNDTTVRDEFAKIDFGNLSGQLSAPLIEQLYKEQRSVAQNWNNKAEQLTRHSRLEGALTVLKPTLDSYGIGLSKTNKTANDMYLTFVGALDQKLTDLEAQTGKPVTDPKVIWGLAGPLLQQLGDSRTLLGRWSPFSNTSPHQFEVPADKAAKITQVFKDRYGREPLPQELGMIYQKALADPIQARKQFGF